MFENIRSQFGIYRSYPDLIYLDYAATSFMPDSVIQAWDEYNTNIGVSINRGSGYLSDIASDTYSGAKKNILAFFEGENYDLAFGKNATECLNLAACVFGSKLDKGDIVLMSPYEHHSNYLPWKRLADRTGAIIVQLPLLDDGDIDYDFVDELEMQNIKVICMSLVSNINAYEIDKKKLKKIMTASDAYTILDVSQAVGHRKVSFKEIGADAYVMSAHKMYGPKSIGAIAINKERIESLPPFLVGGGMVWNSMGERFSWQTGIRKYEAGTQDVANIVSWSSACDFIRNIGMNNIEYNESQLSLYIFEKLNSLNKVHLIPSPQTGKAILSFSVEDMHPHDISDYMRGEKIEMRFGHMCAQGTVKMFGENSICRISWGITTTFEDLDRFYSVLRKCINE